MIEVPDLDELIRYGLRIGVEKALDPMEEDAFLTLTTRLVEDLVSVTSRSEKLALEEAIAILEKVDFTQATEAEKDRAIEKARERLRQVPRKDISYILGALYKSSVEIGERTKESVAEKHAFKIKVKFDEPDKRAMKYAARSNVTYVTDEYGNRADRFSKKAREVVATGIEEGWSRYEIGSELEAEAVGFVNKSKPYWQVVAGMNLNRARSYSALRSYKDAGVQRYRFLSVLDNVTTLQCRFLNGRTFEVKDALARFKEVEANPNDLKQLNPLIRVGKDERGSFLYADTGQEGGYHRLADVDSDARGEMDAVGAFTERLSNSQLQALGVTVPPVHFHCRSTLVPDF